MITIAIVSNKTSSFFFFPRKNFENFMTYSSVNGSNGNCSDSKGEMEVILFENPQYFSTIYQ